MIRMRVIVAAVFAVAAASFGTADAAPLVDISGGMSITNEAATTLCSLGAVGYDDFGNLVGLTAGHCDPGDGAPVYLGLNHKIGPVGTFATHSATPAGQVPPLELDYAVILLDPAKVHPISTTPNGLRIDHIGPVPRQWNWACKDGQTTGLTCGPVWSADGNRVDGYIVVAPGDSGSPLVVGTGLVGFTSRFGYVLPPFMFNGIHRDLADIASQGDVIGRGFEPVRD